MAFTLLETASNIALLNHVLYNTFEEFDNSIEHRNTYIEEGYLVRWIDNPTGAPIKKVLRKCTEKEIAIWNGYKMLVEALHIGGRLI